MSAKAFFALVVTIALVIPATGQEEAPPAEAQKHLLRYRFKKGEVIRWKVTQQAKVRTTIHGTTQTAETFAESVKVWKVLKTSKTSGRATFEYTVQQVNMRQKVTGREEVTYNSATDAKVPPGYENVAESVGVPLAIITLDPDGSIVGRENLRKDLQTSSQLVVPLPPAAVPVGHRWSFPHEIEVPLEDGQIKKVKARQQFTLEEVKGRIAKISTETVILTPVHDNPKLESQLIQRYAKGFIRLDIEAGRIVEQQMDLDKRIIGINGDASSLHYVTRITETLLSASARTARAKAGPAPPAQRKAPLRSTRSRRAAGSRR